MADKRPQESHVESTHGSKDTEDVDVNSVHSSNHWEMANLGDEERKKKFLRLMGASKKSHQGKFVIGESNPPHVSEFEGEQVSQSIEKQYIESMENELSDPSHSEHHGVGFHESEIKKDSEKDTPSKNSRGTDKDDDLKIDQISSSNSWESADLGDDDRKKKFLKLMGAGKKSHQGRFVIGGAQSKHNKAEDSQKISEVIEKQYVESMTQKVTMGARGRHRGIGFVEEEPQASEEPKESGSERTAEIVPGKDRVECSSVSYPSEQGSNRRQEHGSARYDASHPYDRDRSQEHGSARYDASQPYAQNRRQEHGSARYDASHPSDRDRSREHRSEYGEYYENRSHDQPRHHQHGHRYEPYRDRRSDPSREGPAGYHQSQSKSQENYGRMDSSSKGYREEGSYGPQRKPSHGIQFTKSSDN